MKKDKSAVAEELTEYGGVIGKDLPSRRVYFSENNGAENIREKSKDDKRKKYKGTDSEECTVNEAVKVMVETGKDGNKNSGGKGKRGGGMEKLSYKEKKRVADDERVGEDSNHITGEDVEKVEDVKVRKQVANYEEAGDHTDIVASKKHQVKESKVLNDKDVGNKKRKNNGKSMDSEKDVEEMRKVSNDKKSRKDEEQTSGKGKKRVEHVKEKKNGKRTESCLAQTIAGEYGNDEEQTSGKGKKRVEHVKEKKNGKRTESFLKQTVAGEPTDGRKKVEDTKGTSDKGCNALNMKKKRKNARKEEVEAAESISKEISDEVLDADERAKDKETAKVNVNNGELNIKKRKVNADHSTNFSSKKKSKSVSFSGQVEVFPLSNEIEHEEDDCFFFNDEEDDCKNNLVQGKRFSKKEDALIKESVENYILVHDLGEKGLDMVLHVKSHPEVRGCWKEIGAALPWRPMHSVYYRAHIIYERSHKRKWEPEEYDALRRHYEKYGSNWKALADVMGKHRFQVKDTWRRIRLPNLKKGPWTQDEYQTLFDLVNMDLRMKAFEEKKTKHGMLRDNIGWEAICEKLATRSNPVCCMKWYDQLASPMVTEGKWDNADDYRLLAELIKVDASCVDDVDWDNLLKNRSGDVCLVRWKQMTKHIGEYRDKPFAEQVELLSTRFIPDLLGVVSQSGSLGKRD